MDVVTKNTTKNSRWDRKPRLKDGKPVKKRVTPPVIETAKLLYRYRYLQSNDIHAWVGGYYGSIRKMLNDFTDEPHCLFNRPAAQRENANANYTHLVYELDTAGATILRGLGFEAWQKAHHENFIHELMVNRVTFSIELGVRETGARLISWQDILASKQMPAKTREARNPRELPFELTVTKQGKPEKMPGTIAADGKPFGIDYGDNRYFFAPGIEADCATEPLAPKDYHRSSIKRKFMAYIHILENETYRKEWGVPHMYFPFFFPTISRMESAMALLKELTEHNKDVRRFFLFKVFPTLITYGGQAPATGHVATEAFQRVEHKPFNLAEGR